MDSRPKWKWGREKAANLVDQQDQDKYYPELQKKIDELEQKEKRLNLILESVNDGFWDWDVASDYVYFSPAFFTMLGYKPYEFPATFTTLTNLVESADLDEINHTIEHLINGNHNHFSMEFRMKCNDKGIRWILSRGKIVQRDAQGKGIRMLGIHSDITLLKKSEENLKENEYQLKQQNEELSTLNDELCAKNLRIQEINKQLIHAKEKAEESDRLKSAFLANMSHEIRTPMNGIVGFASLLTEPGISESSISQYVEIINNSSRQLLTLIDDIIDISKIEAGQIKIRNTDVHLNAICIELYSLYATFRNEEEIQFSFCLDLNDNEDLIVTDGIRLRQVIHNLLNNAFKFTQKGEIIFGYKVAKNMLEFFVSDSGIGIPSEYHQIIFDRFRQIESGELSKASGTGLGLAISKALVTLMGGEICVQSNPNVGSTFLFTIPLVHSQAKKKPDEKLSISQINFNLHSRKTFILIAEDEEINFMYLKELLENTNISIIRATNGAEAVDFCKTMPEIDLVLLDLKMPIMSGYEAAGLIKSFRSNLPIIAQTAYAMTDDREKAIRSGCDDYISKPIEKRKLMELIKKVLNNVSINP